MAAVDTTSFYQTQLTVLSVFCLLAVLVQHRSQSKAKPQGNGHARTQSVAASAAESGVKAPARATSASALTKQYLIVYAIVMG